MKEEDKKLFDSVMTIIFDDYILDRIVKYSRGDMFAEIHRRIQAPRELQLSLQSLWFLSREDYACLCIEKIIDRAPFSETVPKYVEQLILISLLLRGDERFLPGFVSEQMPEDIYEVGLKWYL